MSLLSSSMQKVFKQFCGVPHYNFFFWNGPNHFCDSMTCDGNNWCLSEMSFNAHQKEFGIRSFMKKKKHHLNQPLFRSRWFYSVYNQSHCTKCTAEAGLQNWLWEHCEHWAHMTRAVWVFPDVSVTSGGTGLSAVTGLPGQTRRLKTSEASFSCNGDSFYSNFPLFLPLLVFVYFR